MDYTVLIVEDDRRLREVLCDYMCSRGDMPVPAEDGRLYICPGSLGRPYHSYAVLETGETLHYGIRMLYT